MTTSVEPVRTWDGPVVLSYGFRPFFLGAAVWAALAMALWILMLTGRADLPTRFDPVSWHAHEFLFGYLNAVVAGFLLTAVPNWTGRPPLVGWTLGTLFALWVVGRVAVAISMQFPPLAVALFDLAMPAALIVVVANEIIKGRNWRNLKVLVLLLFLTVGNAVFHWEAHAGAYAADGYGFRIGLASAIMMIALIGGRIVPAFTGNWLAKRDETSRPAPIGAFDQLALMALLIALIVWIVAPNTLYAGGALTVAGLIHVVRLFRWAGHKTGSEPLLCFLHLAYAFVPLGALGTGIAVLMGSGVGAQAAQHAWMAGGIGLMTLAVMTRATLGHTGRALHADAMTTGLYLALLVSVIARVVAYAAPDASHALHMVSGVCWVGAFGAYIVHYGPMLLSPRETG